MKAREREGRHEGGQAQLDPDGATRLDALRLVPETAGAPIYRGDVFAQSERGGAPLFSYERRVAVTAGGERAAHITRDASGELLIFEQAEFTPA